MVNTHKCPQLIVIDGPNGAGKSTIARRLLPERLRVLTYVNADDIARGLAAYRAEAVAFEAGRIMLAWMKDLAARREDFAFETTLSGRGYASWVNELQQAGYMFHLQYVALPSAEMAVERVKRRVLLGGHNIPTGDIRRRYGRGLHNFFELYMRVADSWTLFDNSTSAGPQIVAHGERHQEPIVIKSTLWREYRERGYGTT